MEKWKKRSERRILTFQGERERILIRETEEWRVWLKSEWRIMKGERRNFRTTLSSSLYDRKREWKSCYKP